MYLKRKIFKKESLNSIGSMQIFYPLLNYLSSNQEYYDLVTNEWSENAKIAFLNETEASFSSVDFKNRLKRSYFDGNLLSIQ